MDIVQLAKDGLAVIQEIEPGVSAALKVGTALGTMGSAVVKVIQKGQQLVSYLISRRKPAAEPQEPAGVEAEKEELPVTTKSDVALLVDINRRMLQDVARFLDEQDIDADLIVVTNDPAYSGKIKFLDPRDASEWTDLVKEFNAAMNAVKHAAGGARVHVFLSTPLPLAFGCGSVWGTVDEATVYHYEKGTYFPVLQVSRELRQ